MPKNLSVLIAAGVVIACAAFMIPALAHEGHGKGATPVSDPNAPKQVSDITARAIDLQTAEVDFGRVESIVRLTGVVQARPDAEFAVSSPLPGIIKSVRVLPGQRVAKGDVLAIVESAELARLAFERAAAVGELDRLQSDKDQAAIGIEASAAQLQSLEARAALARAEVDRLSAAEGTVTENLLAQRKAEALRQVAEVDALKSTQARTTALLAALDRQIANANARLAALDSVVAASSNSHTPPDKPGQLTLIAPTDGLVVSRAATVGAGVGPGETILEISNFSTVQIEGELPDALVSRMQNVNNAPARIYRLSARSEDPIAAGAVRLISPVIDPLKRTAHVLIDVPNEDSRLLKGQFVDIAVVVESTDDAVVVPASAIVKDGPLQWVYVQDGQGDDRVFLKRDVATGSRSDRTVEILEGLVPGDVVVTRGAFSLSLLRGVGASVEPEAGDDGHGHDHSGHSH